jgi:starch synthase
VVKKFAIKRKYDIVHCHDWHTGMLPYLLKNRIKTVFTIHNLAYQGLFPKDTADLFGIEDKNFYIWDQFNFMKIGIQYADMVTTVSQSYAKEILRKELGCGLEEVLRKRKKNLIGIVNGVDYSEFNPETDPALKYKYSLGNIEGKAVNKRFLQNELGLLPQDKMVVSIITRLTEQKGIDLLIGILDKMLTYDIQFVLLGSGEKNYEDKFQKYFANNNVSINIGYSEDLARKIYAGSDLFLMPSRFEPCGLSQLISYKYGTLPLVRKTGGLHDTVKDVKTGGVGFVFEKYTRKAFFDKFVEAYEFYNSDNWRQKVIEAMKLDFGFGAKASEYRALYERVMK